MRDAQLAQALDERRETVREMRGEAGLRSGADVGLRIVEEGDPGRIDRQGAGDMPEDRPVWLGQADLVREEERIESIFEMASMTGRVKLVGVAQARQTVAATEFVEKRERAGIRAARPGDEVGEERLGRERQLPVRHQPSREFERTDLAPLEGMHDVGLDPAPADRVERGPIREDRGQALEAAEVEQDAAQIEEQDVEARLVQRVPLGIAAGASSDGKSSRRLRSAVYSHQGLGFPPATKSVIDKKTSRTHGSWRLRVLAHRRR